jgi:hypothetical protein
MKTFETTLRDGRIVRIMANDAYEARKKIEELYGHRQCPTLPKIVPH